MTLDETPSTSVKGTLDYIHIFFRKDFGGQDPAHVIANRLSVAGIVISPDIILAYTLGADQTREGIQTRVMRRVDAAKRLLGI